MEQDYYKPDLMLPDDPEDPKVWQSTRMVAPGVRNKYFFSTEGVQYVAKDQRKQPVASTVKVARSFGTSAGKIIEDEAVE